MTGQEWRRRWQRSLPISSALADQNGLPRGGAGSHDADLLRELHEQHAEWRTTRLSPAAEIDHIPDQPNGDASEPVVDRHLVVAALGRLTQEHRDVLRECYFRGSSVAEAAHALGLAPGTVMSRTYYALRALRLAVEELAGVE
jgi:RNA polymerase sigma-70 factor (ECF subfamily)